MYDDEDLSLSETILSTNDGELPSTKDPAMTDTMDMERHIFHVAHEDALTRGLCGNTVPVCDACLLRPLDGSDGFEVGDYTEMICIAFAAFTAGLFFWFLW
ncbi:hypothetical protein Bbelb_112690 [Branchiostoma belcheri]|nr:hypothetical protein Bbelb_112690 [Branchiostoma belcheri]